MKDEFRENQATKKKSRKIRGYHRLINSLLQLANRQKQEEKS
jgi:hypothetical protein